MLLYYDLQLPFSFALQLCPLSSITSPPSATTLIRMLDKWKGKRMAGQLWPNTTCVMVRFPSGRPLKSYLM